MNHLASLLEGEAWHGAGHDLVNFTLKHQAFKPEEGGVLWCNIRHLSFDKFKGWSSFSMTGYYVIHLTSNLEGEAVMMGGVVLTNMNTVD